MVATLDDLAYDGSHLMVGGTPAQLVYRRALVEDVTEDGPLAVAAREGRAVVVNPFRVHVASNKKILALLQGSRRMGISELAAALELPPSTVHGIAFRKSRWTPRSRSTSSIETRLIASPVNPARPVRPIRWT